jgi:hypothetical protein
MPCNCNVLLKFEMKVTSVSCKWRILKRICVFYFVVLRCVDIRFLHLRAQLFFGMSVYANCPKVGNVLIIRQAAEGYAVYSFNVIGSITCLNGDSLDKSIRSAAERTSLSLC